MHCHCGAVKREHARFVCADFGSTTIKLVMVQQLACDGVNFREFDGLVADYSRQRVTEETVEKLIALAKVINLNITIFFVHSFISLVSMNATLLNKY